MSILEKWGKNIYMYPNIKHSNIFHTPKHPLLYSLKYAHLTVEINGEWE